MSRLELPSQAQGIWAVLASVPLVTTGRALGAWPLLVACGQHKAGENGLKSHPLGACGDIWGQQLCLGDGVCFSVPCPCRGTHSCPRSAPSQRRERLFPGSAGAGGGLSKEPKQAKTFQLIFPPSPRSCLCLTPLPCACRAWGRGQAGLTPGFTGAGRGETLGAAACP